MRFGRDQNGIDTLFAVGSIRPVLRPLPHHATAVGETVWVRGLDLLSAQLCHRRASPPACGERSTFFRVKVRPPDNTDETADCATLAEAT